MDKIAKGLSSHLTSLTNTFSIILVAIIELLVGTNVFQCPCEAEDYGALANPSNPDLAVSEKRQYYSLAFIVWPAMALFFMALAVSGSMLRCLIEHRFRMCNIKRQFIACKFGIRKSKSVLVPPVAWIFVVLMDGGYYTCFSTKFPDSCLPAVATLNATMVANRATLVRENQWHRSLSQLVALTMLGCGAVLLGLSMICGYLCSGIPYYHRRYIDIYRSKEMEMFETVAEKSLTDKLNKKWETFFKEAKESDWDEVSALPIGSPYERNGRNCYTAFDAWLLESEETSGRADCCPRGGKSRVAPSNANPNEKSSMIV